MTDTAIETETETVRLTADVVVVTRYRGLRGLLRRILRRTPYSHVLLIERDWPPFEGAWALPGGHADTGETTRQAGARELGEEVRVYVNPAHLIQVAAFDRPDRDPRGRYVTVAYLAVVPADTPIAAGDDARTARWWPLNDLPQLAFDHDEILHVAVATS
ncbi:NUDIX domain-containing protein [Streptomyces sp. NPDC059679]|uniref:NUDIX domain-containing protein n=1 Tax=Streptomyces sp. NPDC059679 TaxID=3346903 RepID=UPI0036BAE00F